MLTEKLWVVSRNLSKLLEQKVVFSFFLFFSFLFFSIIAKRAEIIAEESSITLLEATRESTFFENNTCRP